MYKIAQYIFVINYVCITVYDILVCLDLVYLYVVNHNNGTKKETVEKFRFNQKRRTLFLVKTFEGDPTFIQSVSFKYSRQLLQTTHYNAL